MPVQKTCSVCGKEFSVANARAATAKTCSQACRGVLIAKAYEEQRVQSECLKCGEPISVSVGRAARGNGMYCGRACKDLAQVGKRFTDLVSDGEEIHLATGYVHQWARSHPFASRGKVFQHRLVMEAMMAGATGHHFLVEINGRNYLKPGIDVHHKNEIKDDNRPENLIACTKSAHKDIHAGRIPMVGEVWPSQGDEIAATPRTVYRTCEHCGATFTKKRSDVNRGAGKFCSSQCHRASQATSGLPALIPSSCQVCGAGFVAKRHRVLAGQGRYCSTACRIKFLATTHTKEK